MLALIESRAVRSASGRVQNKFMVGRKEQKKEGSKRSRRHLLLTAGRECLSCIVVFHKPVPAINGIANSIRLMSTSPVIGRKRRKRTKD